MGRRGEERLVWWPVAQAEINASASLHYRKRLSPPELLQVRRVSFIVGYRRGTLIGGNQRLAAWEASDVVTEGPINSR
jgi:hypothetical protein